MNASATNIGSNPQPRTLNSEPQTHYPEPSPDLIQDIRKRLAELPRDVAAYVDEALKRESIEHVANYLWKAGFCFASSDLYEYRRTLFPPDAMVDPYTAGPPILRNSPEVGRGVPAEPLAASADSLSASTRTTDDGRLTTDQAQQTKPDPQTANPEPVLPPTSAPESNNHQLSTINVPGSSLLTDLRDVIKRHVVLPEMAAEALALWVVHTYAFTLRQVTTYIGVVSPEKRCGKTTLLELLGLLANRSLTAANISPSALFRVIEETRPTLLIDEADTFLQGRDELAGILNAGYRKGKSYVVRVAERKARKNDEPNDPTEFGEWTNERPDGSPGPTEFAKYSCWCPKVMAAIGRLPDTLADRCIMITMQRKMPGETCERMRQLNAADYRKRCAEFVRQHREAIAQSRPETPSGLNDRAADIWEPLLAIADLASGEWPQLAREAAQKLSANDEDLSLIGYFLKDLRNLMIINNVDRMLSRDIISALNPLHDRPWEDLRRGREINEWWLGWQLRQLGMRTKTMRVGEAIAKGYTLADLEGAFRRYVTNAEGHLTQPTLAEQLSGKLGQTAQEDQIEAQFEKLMHQLLAALPKESPTHNL